MKVFLDLDGTLHDSHSFWFKASKTAVNAMLANGLDQYSDFNKAFGKLEEIYSREANSAEHYDLLVKALVPLAKRRGKSFDKIVSAGVNAFKEVKHDGESFKPNPHVVDFLTWAKANGVELFLVTSGIRRKQWDKLHRLGLSDFFDEEHVLTTGDVGFFKGISRYVRPLVRRPLIGLKNHLFYGYVLRKTKSKPEDVLMVGDNEKNDIIPANKRGISTIRFFAGKYGNHEVNTMGTYSATNFKEVKQIVKRHFEL
ncbi:HAD hydrolase-like protein [Candidatus Micrarchaeota archaeon]|nr:HAD hydrolase-like protein [Candidatus Micrarchaeota archaeon]